MSGWDSMPTQCQSFLTHNKIHRICECSSQGTQLLEIYALEIQMYTARKNNKELKKLYEASLQIKSAIAHPLIMGVIRECGGSYPSVPIAHSDCRLSVS